jgi:hypothetical protein
MLRRILLIYYAIGCNTKDLTVKLLYKFMEFIGDALSPLLFNYALERWSSTWGRVEELLERKSSGFGLQTLEYGSRDTRKHLT